MSASDVWVVESQRDGVDEIEVNVSARPLIAKITLMGGFGLSANG
jgi:hypothetical protein